MFCPKCGTENPETGKFCRSCGTDISGISNALSNKPSGNWTDDSNNFISRREKRRQLKHSNDPEDLFSSGLRSVIMGFGFFLISAVLFFTGVAGGHAWWWAMLFPAVASLANGVSQIAKANGLEKRQARANPVMQNQIPTNSPNLNLPPNQTEYVKPQGSIYDTGDLVAPPSVTEHTTKHLEMNSEGETMTLPKK